MGAMAGGEESAAGIRVSDAERDAAAERLSAATGDGRLTLEEFSQRMELATTARTRADLDGLVADLPADAATAGSAASGPPSWHVSPIGGLKIRGPWRMDRHVIVASLVGGAQLDLSQAQLAAPEVTLTKVSLVGGTKVTVPPGIRVEASGFSLIGGTRIDAGPEPGPGAPTVRIRAFALVGGIRIRRSGTSGRLRQPPFLPWFTAGPAHPSWRQGRDRGATDDLAAATDRLICARIPSGASVAHGARISHFGAAACPAWRIGLLVAVLPGSPGEALGGGFGRLVAGSDAAGSWHAFWPGGVRWCFL